jgi:hypothetical protein
MAASLSALVPNAQPELSPLSWLSPPSQSRANVSTRAINAHWPRRCNQTRKKVDKHTFGRGERKGQMHKRSRQCFRPPVLGEDDTPDRRFQSDLSPIKGYRYSPSLGGHFPQNIFASLSSGLRQIQQSARGAAMTTPHYKAIASRERSTAIEPGD